MAEYRIALLPGDGIGKDVMDAAKILLEATRLDAQYYVGDVGWEFWKNEGDPLPGRTLELLRNTDTCLLGAITSKPKDEAQLELGSKLRSKGYQYYSPVVRLRQEFNLHTNIRPCRRNRYSRIQREHRGPVQRCGVPSAPAASDGLVSSE
jgi:isocitrate/isopropylmalate dehydrogenase